MVNSRSSRQQQAPLQTELIPISVAWSEWEYFSYNPSPRRHSSLSLVYPQKHVAGTPQLDIQVGSDDLWSQYCKTTLKDYKRCKYK